MAFHAAGPPYVNGSNTVPSARGSWRDSRDPPPSGGRAYAHIKDIIAASQPRLGRDASLRDYLAEAEASLRSAKSALDFGRPDTAFGQYLIASEMVLQIIPHHKDFGFTTGNNKNWAVRYDAAFKGVKAMSVQMSNVKAQIEENNERNGTQQLSNGTRFNAGDTTGEEVVPNSSSRPPSQSSTAQQSTSNVPDSLRIDKARPTSVPKPPALRGEPLAGSNDLTSRFARLRASVQETSTASTLSMPKPSDFQDAARGRLSIDSVSGTHTVRPAGPREMPTAPSIPPKLPVLMPKPPDPTYSPTSTSNGYHHESHRPPMERHSNYYNQPLNAVPTLQAHRVREDNPYRPKTPNGVNSAIIAKSRSVDIPHNTLVDAQTLAEYIKKYNVLLIDVRDRSQFDEGHIFATSIICVEPLSLKEGVSAEALEERLVISPENEQNLFARRNEFDLVVYYDQDTNHDKYLKGPPTQNNTPHLRALFDTLYEFNEYKPLKDGRPPALLMGGVDAWVDLMTSQSLVTSKTSAMLGSTRTRVVSTSRPIGRQRMASTNSRIEIRNRRLKDHKFLDEQEQKAWREKAEQEQVVTNDQAQYSDGEYVEDVAPNAGYFSDYESFLRKFPAVEQQSMIMPSRRPVPPPPVPRYQPPPVPSIPTRPAPAIPRPSYSGQSDILQTHAPLARVTSSTRQPFYNSAIAAQTRKVPKTGLTNFGVTCYMNSTLQCLSATIPLAQFFMNEPQYRANVQKNWKGSSGIMPEIFANVVRSLWKGDVNVIKPTTFRNFCGRMNREWVIDRQQDAKEFFDFLVDCLHEDLNFNWQRNPLRPLTAAEEMQREKYTIPEAGPIEWIRYEHRDSSYISSLFAGQHASRLKCQSCRGTSTTYEAFYSISIEIPKSGTGDIYQCLRSYTQEERLSEAWKCPYCRCERQATKQIILTRLPQFLVIHFKRFSASKTERARKIHTPIDFPLHGLTMDEFVTTGPANKPPPIDEATGLPKIEPAVTPPFNYDAYGVLRHLGNSGDGGHYVSIVRDPGRNCWRKFDDERHTDFDPSRLGRKDGLQNGEAYIVFFQRIGAR